MNGKTLDHGDGDGRRDSDGRVGGAREGIIVWTGQVETPQMAAPTSRGASEQLGAHGGPVARPLRRENAVSVGREGAW